MIHVSNEFKELMETRTNFKQYAIITTDEWTLRLDESQFTASNNYIVDGSGISGLPLGVAIQKNIQIEIINENEQYSDYDFTGAEIHLFLDFPLNSTTERISKGIYTVLSPATYGDTIIITAVDKMHKADVQYKRMIDYPATAAAVVQDICQICGFFKGNISFANDSFVIQTPPEGTCRQILGQIAMLACGNARINNEGRLDIIPYSYDGFNSEDYHTLRNFTSLKIEATDVSVTGVKMVIRGETADEDQTVMVGSEGYAITVENSLVEGQENVLLTWLYDRLSTLHIRPFNGDMVSNPLVEFMDLAKIVDRRGNEYYTIITDVNFQVLGFTTVKNTFPSTLTLTTTYPSEATRVEQIARKLVEYERKSRSEAIDKLNKNLATSSGLYQTDVEQPDGSVISYFHDKPSLEESKNVLKITAEAIGISNDGGETYHGGFTFDAETVMKFIQTEGLEADWVKVGNKTITTVIDESVSDLQNQIDGNIESHYYDYAPTLNNVPASSWTTEDERLRHEGDLFFDKTTGYKYRFFKNGDTWQWALIKDTDITTALESIKEVETELSTFEGEISAKVTSVETTANGAATTAAEAKVAAGNITLVVTGSDGKKTSIQVADGAINLTGEVLAQRIAVATLMAKDLTATGKFQVDNGVWQMLQDTTGLTVQTVTNTSIPQAVMKLLQTNAVIGIWSVDGNTYNGVQVDTTAAGLLHGTRSRFIADSSGCTISGPSVKITSTDSSKFIEIGDDSSNVALGLLTRYNNKLLFELFAEKADVLMDFAEFSTESELETYLNEQLYSMDLYTSKQFVFTLTSVSTYNAVGVLYKSSSYGGGYARFNAYGFSADSTVTFSFVKGKMMGSWQPIEWENPPMINTIEYRTTRRRNGKPLYTKRISVGTLPSTGVISATIGSVDKGSVTWNGEATSTTETNSFPVVFYSSGVGAYAYVTYSGTTATISVRTLRDMTAYSAAFEFEYTKS